MALNFPSNPVAGETTYTLGNTTWLWNGTSWNVVLTDTGFATENYVDTTIGNLIDSAPGALDTLNELAAALGDDANFATTVTTALGNKAPIDSPSFTGNISVTGTGNRITGDFSNATFSNRVAFQTSAVNTNTNFTVIPNGTATSALFDAYNSSSMVDCGIGRININATDLRILSTITGSGTYLPMTFHTGGSERLRISTTGTVSVAGAMSFTSDRIVLGISNSSITSSNSGLYVDPIRNEASANTVLYNPSTKEVTYSPITLESVVTLTGSTGTVAHDCSLGAVFLHNSISADFVANFTSVPLITGSVFSVSVLLNQGATPRSITSIQIGGVGATVIWAGGSPPSTNANSIDAISYSFINTSGGWIVLGSATAYI